MFSDVDMNNNQLIEGGFLINERARGARSNTTKNEQSFELELGKLKFRFSIKRNLLILKKYKIRMLLFERKLWYKTKYVAFDNRELVYLIIVFIRLEQIKSD